MTAIKNKHNAVFDVFLQRLISIISNIVGIVLALIAVKIISDYAKIEPLLGEQTESLVDDAILDSGIIDTEIE